MPPEPAGCPLSGVAGNMPFGSYESCSWGAVSLETSYLKLPAKMQLLLTAHCWLPCKALVLEKPGTGRQRNHPHCRGLPSRPIRTRKQNLSFLQSLQHLLQTKFNVMPAGKAKIFKGPKCTFRSK